MFTDTKFMNANDKRLTLKAWKTFLKHGLQLQHFTKQLYHHLIQHCSFIAHYDLRGFYGYYFTNPGRTKDFIGQFATGGAVEYGGTEWWLRGDYEDINRAMCEAVEPYKADIYGNCSDDELKQDKATIVALMAKYSFDKVQAVKGGYRFS